MKKKFMQWLLLAAVITYSAGCSKNQTLSSNTFVLVHGSWQAPYVWNTVKSELEKAGQKVIVVELPAHGNDFTSPAEVSIDVYRDKVISAINNTNSKVILVGHSLGGMVVSAVAEKTPSKIKKLIYIAGFVPVSGQTLIELAGEDAQSLLGPALISSKDQLLLDVRQDAITSIFCQDGSDAVKKLVLDNYRSEPAIPFTNPVTVTDANFGTVDKYYIHTLQDHAIGIDLQNKMANAAHITKTFSLNTGHSPFLTQPDEVTKLLLQIAN
ncbi:MAG TPA: alpha/beta fold hydrolase [Ginsengibacter sp.]